MESSIACLTGLYLYYYQILSTFPGSAQDHLHQEGLSIIREDHFYNWGEKNVLLYFKERGLKKMRPLFGISSILSAFNKTRFLFFRPCLGI